MGWELTVHIEGSLQSADHVLRRLSAEGIKVLAHSCSSYFGGVNLLLVTENVDTACAAVRDAGYKCATKAIIWVVAPCRVGLAAALGERLRDEGIGILYTYGSWDSWPRAVFVFKTSDDVLAFHVLTDTYEDLLRTHRTATWLASLAK